jgi:short-subunit dehydrogenase
MDTSTEIWDALDFDLIIKVLANTVFSPVFVFFIPVFYVFQGLSIYSAPVVVPAVYCVFVSTFWGLKWYSRLYRNQASLLFGPPPLDWGEQVVLITGGASGVGELIANTLAVRNVTVAVLDVKPIVSENYNIYYYKCDISNLEEIQSVAKEIKEELGEPTIIINNAGVVQGKLILDLTPEDLKQSFGVNVIGQFNMLKVFLPDMIKNNHGHVVTVSSVLGMLGACQLSDYTATKGAVINLHESLRYELDKRYNAKNVRTTLVLPGHIMTPMFSSLSWPKSRIWQFFIPSLQPITVAKAVIRALDNQHSETIHMPFYSHFAFTMRGMPSFARDFCQWISGADNAMKTFVKVSSRRPDEGNVPSSQANDKGPERAHEE